MEGNLIIAADQGSTLDRGIFDDQPHFDFLGIVRKVELNRYVLLEVRTAFQEGDEIELVPFKGDGVRFKANALLNAVGSPISQARVTSLVRLPYIPGAQVGNIIRKLAQS
jgi:putative protease